MNPVETKGTTTKKIKRRKKIVFGKYTKEQWDATEVTLPLRELAVIRCLRDIASCKFKQIESKSGSSTTFLQRTLKAYGDRIYVEVLRPKIRADLKLSEDVKDGAAATNGSTNNSHSKTNKKGKRKKKGKGKKNKRKGWKVKGKSWKDDIIFKNTRKKALKDLNEVTLRKQEMPQLKTVSSIELQVVMFMYSAQLYLDGKIDKLQDVYDLILSLKKVLSVASAIANISPTLVQDALRMQSILVQKANFNIKTLFTNFPRLLVSNWYSRLYPNLVIKPYPFQTKLVQALHNKAPTLILYKTMPGQGKTTAIIAVTQYALTHMKLGSRVIFCCFSEPVRSQVARLAYNARIKFAIVSQCTEIRHFLCGRDKYSKFLKTPILYICDLESTLQYLLQKDEECIFFLDEPTLCAEFPKNEITRQVIMTIHRAPRKTILCSATLPAPHEIPTVLEAYPYKDKKIVVLTSKVIGVSCELVRRDGVVFSPLSSIRSVSKLTQIIDTMQINPFLLRCLNPSHVCMLYERLNLEKLKIPNIDREFKNIESINHDRICQFGLQLLRILQETKDNAMITRVCTKKAKRVRSKYDPRTLLTADAHNYTGGCLFISDIPKKDALITGQSLLDRLPQLHKVFQKYEKEMREYAKRVSQVEKRIKNVDEQSKRIQQILKPSLTIGDEYRINSYKHLEKFGRVHPDANTQIITQTLYPLEMVRTPLPVPDIIVKLLFLGVGIYNPDSKELNPKGKVKYTTTCLSLFAEGLLPFLFSTYYISYGANYPLFHVIIDDDFAIKHSIQTVFQLMGRAGRVGKSWIARIHFTGKAGPEKLINECFDPQPSVEGKTMEYWAKELLKEETQSK